MKILGLDTETTGVNPKQDKPVQVSVILSENGAQRVLMNTLVNPLMPIDPRATEVHRISQEDVQSAPDYGVVAWQVKSLIDAFQPDMLLTYNGSTFDIPLLDTCLGGPISALPHLDLLDVVYRNFPSLQSFRLGNVVLALTGNQLEGWHDATADVRALFSLLDTILVKLNTPLEALLKDMETPRPYAIFPISKHHKGKPLHEVPLSFATFMLDKPDLRPDLRASLEWVVAQASA